MRKTLLTVKVDAETKEQSEAILRHLGLTASEAVTIFLRQVILRKGLPFPVCDTSYSDSLTENSTDIQAYDDSSNKQKKGRFYAEVDIFD